MQNLTEQKQRCLKHMNRKSGFVCLCFDPLRWKFKSFTSIDMFSWLGGKEIAPRLRCEMGSIPGSGNNFMLTFPFFICCCVFIIYITFCNSFFNVNSHSIFYHSLQNLWPTLRVSKCISFNLSNKCIVGVGFAIA